MSRLPGSVLYVCALNRVRSPMAAGLTRLLFGDAMRVESCGLQPSQEPDPLAAAVMDEVGVDLSDHRPAALTAQAMEDFDMVVALSPEARDAVEALPNPNEAEIEYWPVPDPTLEEGSRDMRLEAYRHTRRDLEQRIARRFGPPPEWE